MVTSACARLARETAGPTPNPCFREAIVVLGAALEGDAYPGAGLRSRLEHALSLAQRHPAAAVLVTGGGEGPIPEAHVMAAWLLERGIAPGRIFVEERASNTRENMTESVPMLASLGVERVHLVTEQFHMKRSRMLMDMVLRQSGMGDLQLEASAAPDANFAAAARESAVPARDLRLQTREWLNAPRPSLNGKVTSPAVVAQGVAAALGRKGHPVLVFPSRE